MLSFTPTPEVPALQFLDSVAPGGAAEEAGLRAGDFLLEVLTVFQFGVATRSSLRTLSIRYIRIGVALHTLTYMSRLIGCRRKSLFRIYRGKLNCRFENSLQTDKEKLSTDGMYRNQAWMHSDILLSIKCGKSVYGEVI
jgi:hypothetical protein